MAVGSASVARAQDVTRSFMNQVYLWMAIGLVVTGWIAAAVAQNEPLIRAIQANPILLIGLIIAQLGLVFALAGWVMRMSPMMATAIFLGYAALTGLTLSFIFMIYTAASISLTFFVTAGTFGVMSVWGFCTKQDLTSIGNICFMGLIGIILASLANMFFRSPAMYWVITYVGIAIFTGLIAYDTQKLKTLPVHELDEGATYKMAIRGALSLYLDFINLFLLLLRLLGRRK